MDHSDHLQSGLSHLLLQKKERRPHLQEGRPGHCAQADQGDVLDVGKPEML